MKYKQWTIVDFTTVANNTVEVLAGNMPPESITVGQLIKAFKQAQNLLPENFRRIITGVHHIKTSMPYLKKALDNRVKEWRITYPEKTFFTFDTIVQAKSNYVKVKDYNRKVLIRDSKENDSLLQSLGLMETVNAKIIAVKADVALSTIPLSAIEKAISNLFEALTESISIKVYEKLAIKMDSMEEKVTSMQEQQRIMQDLLESLFKANRIPLKPSVPEKKHNPCPVAEERNKVLTIGVLGLLANQQNTVTKNYLESDIAFRFYDQFPKQQPPSVDHMIGMTGFMSHSTDSKAISHYGIRYHRTNNGVTSLLVVIDGLLKKFKTQ